MILYQLNVKMKSKQGRAREMKHFRLPSSPPQTVKKKQNISTKYFRQMEMPSVKICGLFEHFYLAFLFYHFNGCN